uniref:Uncharacterized protein n=1 Tax=Cannabis sativa TaxID=3483 RepID=A0A803QVR9_CANSA
MKAMVWIIVKSAVNYFIRKMIIIIIIIIIREQNNYYYFILIIIINIMRVFMETTMPSPAKMATLTVIPLMVLQKIKIIKSLNIH